MKFIRIIPLLLILSGIAVLGVGGYQLAETKIKENKSLEEARNLIEPKANAAAKEIPRDENGLLKPEFGDVVGLLDIPAIDSELAIVEGTDPNDLKKGVGHYKGSYYPGENGQIVLSGHRDTVFRRLGELEIGDILNIKMPDGDFAYEITRTKIVDADDTSIITLQNEEEELIVTTCYPFRYVGNAPDRYIIYAKPKKES
ncbi:class D sortase [Bacillus sp. FJAT-27225]|uniref:class D sortase n=1 Tax=Bacillus sp. FJAT-27225 TaxID=1743144 RepID=UPI00080C2EFF|nr:class D sortase [Bacillus sp. FJAT-27225]OCA91316.1 class D sortase [Bacillus sp. FJAT-27225]